MEIFELGQLLLGLAEVCGCFLEFMAVGSNVGAVATAVKATKQARARRTAKLAGDAVPKAPTWWWLLFAVLMFAGAFLTMLVFLKWTNRR